MPPFEGSPDLSPAMRHTSNEVIKDKMERLNSIDSLSEIIEHIEDTIKHNPHLLDDNDEREKLEKAKTRLAELLEDNRTTLH